MRRNSCRRSANGFLRRRQEAVSKPKRWYPGPEWRSYRREHFSRRAAEAVSRVRKAFTQTARCGTPEQDTTLPAKLRHLGELVHPTYGATAAPTQPAQGAIRVEVLRSSRGPSTAYPPHTCPLAYLVAVRGGRRQLPLRRCSASQALQRPMCRLHNKRQIALGLRLASRFLIAGDSSPCCATVAGPRGRPLIDDTWRCRWFGSAQPA